MARLITTLLVILGLSAGGYGIVKYQQPITPLPESSLSAIEEAWIEVVIGPVFSKVPGQAIELKNGDVVKKGDTIETGKKASATLHFPDSSILRIDKETTITLSDINFKMSDYSLIVKIGLASGRIWSKVVGLSTPESTWEVKTSNTVATVRGTAFGMGYKNGVSWVLGSENKITVALLDPDTKEKIESSEVLIEANKVIEISNKDVAEASATTTPILKNRIVSASGNFVNDSWIKSMKEEDKKFDAEIEKTKKSETKDATAESKTADKKTEEIKETTEISNGIQNDNKGELSVTTDRKLDNITEGETIKFKANLKNGDSRRDVTSSVNWSVIGSIGSISKDGAFTAKLGDEVSEVGQAVGFVVAGFNGSSEVSKSELIKILAKQPEIPLDIGGQ